LGVLLTYKKSKDDDDDDENKAKKNNEQNENKNEVEDRLPVVGLRELERIESTTPSSSTTTTPKEQQQELPGSQQQQQQQPQPQPQRYLEILVHNVSHTDLVLSLEAPFLQENDPPSEELDSYCLCRPRFSAFDQYSRRVLDSLGGTDAAQPRLVTFPRYERSDDTPRYHIKPEPTKMEKLPIGFALSPSPTTTNTKKKNSFLTVTTDALTDLRVRGRDAPRVQRLTEDGTHINAVFFPLMATLLPQWHAKIKEKYAYANAQEGRPPNPKKVLILVSGVGTPRNWTHSMTGNSTEQCAKLMQRFVQFLYPDLVVVQVHSETNIFRYDENISFVQNDFIPCIQSYRDAHAKGLPYPDELLLLMQQGNNNNVTTTKDDDRAFSTDWRKSMSVTLSFADGSPARNHAIQAALRTYKPTYFHCWQLKTFWHESKIVDSDIEVHSFEEMEALPPMETDQLNDRPLVLQVVQEMKAFRNEMTKILKGTNDISSFWLRKTHKPVLAVLAVEVGRGKIKLYRGTNMEVSMPTGSLCAERNVIGTAFADNPALRRQDLKLIAVLSVLPPSNLSRPASTASFAGYFPDELLQAPSSSSVLLAPPSLLKPPLQPIRPPTTTNIEDDEWILQDATALPHTPVLATPPLNPTTGTGATFIPSLALDPSALSASPSSTPARRIPLYNHSAVTFKASNQRRTVVVHSNEVSRR
jgi:hypothetical protein